MAQAGLPKKKSKNELKPMVVGMRGSADWKRWLDEFAIFRRMTLVDLIDRALEEDAKRAGFRVPPMR